MSHIKTIVVDDEQACIETLHNDLKLYTDIAVKGCFTKTSEALEFIRKFTPDLLFLDMHMADMHGLDFLQELADIPNAKGMCVVFYSGYDYKLEAIRHSAFDYLAKPYTIEDLDTVIERVTEKLLNPMLDLRNEVNNLRRKTDLIALNTENGYLIVRASQVVYFEYGGKDNRVWIVTLKDNTTHTLKYATKKEDIIDADSSFILVSNNNIININHLFSIKSVAKKHFCVFYPPFDGIQIEVTSKYYPSLKKKLVFL